MTRIGISITKTIAFRSANQEFSNVYYYDGLNSVPSDSEAAGYIDTAVTREKLIHSLNVSFSRGRCWLETGVKSTSEMLNQHNLSGTGSAATVANMDRERTYLFRLRAGNDSRGNPVYLRKWYHSCGRFGTAAAPTPGQLEQTTGFAQSERDALVAQLPPIGSISGGAGVGTLVSKKGRVTTAGALWSAHPFLEHHQLGDMWRAQ